MTGLGALIKRNVKLYFRDKGMFFTSLITPIILLVLYSTFLKNVFEESFKGELMKAGAQIPDSLIKGCVGGQLISSLLAVSCVTVPFCSNLIMVQDKLTGARRDLNVAPVRSSTLALGYYVATLVSSLIISYIALGACFLYLGVTGWYLSALDVVSLIVTVFLITLFGTALSSCVVFPLKTNGQASAVGTIVSAGYGFVCGAYMPISSFSDALQKVLSFLPGTYGTSLLRNFSMRGTFAEMAKLGFPDEVVEKIKDSVDCNLCFFGHGVKQWEMFAVVIGTVLLLIFAYIMMNALTGRKKRIKNGQ